MFTGRTVATEKALHRRLHRDSAEHLGIQAIDLEIAVVDTPARP